MDTPATLFKLIVKYPSGAPPGVKALAVFQKAVHDNPYDADFHFILGEALLGGDRASDALGHLEAARRLESFNPEHLWAWALCLFRLGHVDEATEAFREIAHLRPADVEARNALGASLARAGRFREAQTALHEALRGDKGPPHVWNNLGVSLWGLGDREEALAAFRRAADEDGTSAVPRLNEGMALARLARHEEALGAFARVLEIEATNAEAVAWRGGSLAALKRPKEALAAFEEALTLHPRVLESEPALQRVHGEVSLAAVRAEFQAQAAIVERVRTALLTLIGGLGQGAAWLVRSVPRLLSTLAAVLVLYLVAVLLPVVMTYYDLRDEVVTIARSPTRDDSEIIARLAHAVEKRHVESEHPDFKVATGSQSRTIAVEYHVNVRLLPRLEKRISFRIDVDEPSLPGGAP
jgi:Flp pilus assembly protein TadD